MNKRTKRKLLGVLRHLDRGLTGVAKHTIHHCEVIRQHNERITRLEGAMGEALATMEMKKKKDLN